MKIQHNNKRMRQIGFRRVTLGVAAMAAVLLAGCSQQRDKVVVSMQDMSQPFSVALVKDLRDEADKLNVDLLVMDGRANGEKQLVDLDSARVQQMDGVVVLPRDESVVPGIQSLIDDGIAVTAVSRHPENLPEKAGFVGADNVAIGKALAEWVVSNYPDGARIAILSGAEGSSPATDRDRGIRDVLSAAGGKYAVVLEQSAGWNRGKALDVMRKYIASHPQDQLPQVVLGANDEMALGALDAISFAKLDGLHIAVLGCDASTQALRLIKAGKMAASAEQSASGQAREALRGVVAQFRSGDKPVDKAVPPVLITAANLQQAEHFSEL